MPPLKLYTWEMWRVVPGATCHRLNDKSLDRGAEDIMTRISPRRNGPIDISQESRTLGKLQQQTNGTRPLRTRATASQDGGQETASYGRRGESDSERVRRASPSYVRIRARWSTTESHAKKLSGAYFFARFLAATSFALLAGRRDSIAANSVFNSSPGCSACNALASSS